MTNKLRNKLNEIIFGTDTPAGKAFDIVLLIAIIASVAAVVLDSISAINIRYGALLYVVEWTFTILFTIEYLLRIISAKSAKKYVRSFFGIIDLIAIIPMYLSIIVAGTQALLVLRTLRLLRFFRIFKLSRYIGESRIILETLKASKKKITVFLVTVVALVSIIGTLMYLIEGPVNGFTSIPVGMYWAIVTMTTVGYGNLVPMTVLGKLLASVLMIIGYGIIAVPTGIITAEFVRVSGGKAVRIPCYKCGSVDHAKDALYCRYCSAKLRIKK